MASSHFDSSGNAHMVDVSDKDVTRRIAVACADVQLSPHAAQQIRQGSAGKGDVLNVARLAAIQASKWTSHLIPLCHAIPIESVSVTFQWLTEAEPKNETDASTTAQAPPQRLRCEVTAITSGKTGIEMEALTAASTAALTIYDMLKSVDKAIQIGPIWLTKKSGGRGGEYSSDLPPKSA